VNASSPRTADHRISVSCPDVPDPLRLPGESNEVVIASITSTEDRNASHFPRATTAHLQSYSVARGKPQGREEHTQPVEAPVPSGPAAGKPSARSSPEASLWSTSSGDHALLPHLNPRTSLPRLTGQ
jgi:hypothetical protein